MKKTKIRRAARLVEDLKTLGVITDDAVICKPSLRGGIMIVISVPREDESYLLIKDAFKQEFPSSEVLVDMSVIEDSKGLQFVLE